MSNRNLQFFNKEGDSLNFKYDETQEIFQGDILFHENSTDTFKTYGLYVLEKIPAFRFEDEGLGTAKFQLFNEHGMTFYSARPNAQRIRKIEPVNNDPSFYSKWIYGANFEAIYPLGSIVAFNTPILEFTNPNQSYIVVGSKKDAIMLVSQVDNATFETNFSALYTNEQYFADAYLRGLNAFGVRKYITSEYESNLSVWSEPEFYDRIYENRKINVVNSEKNNGTYTVKNSLITDLNNYEYRLLEDVTESVVIEVVLGTDLPKIYDDGIIFENGKLRLSNYLYFPTMLRPNMEFKVVGSLLNQNFYTMSEILDFETVFSEKEYILDEQVIYKGKIYQCTQPYIHSYSSDETRFMTPSNSPYWSMPTFIKVNEVVFDETLLNAQIYLTKDRYFFEQEFIESSDITKACAVAKFKEELKIFNIDLSIDLGEIIASLKYPSKYVTVNYYDGESTSPIGYTRTLFERLIEVDEQLKYEQNTNLSENFKYNIVFTDLDEYGLKIRINKMEYDEEMVFVYNNGVYDRARSIDKTLRNWLTRHYLSLYKLGILCELNSTFVPNEPSSLFFNSIMFETEYPNVPMNIDRVLVGSTAKYLIEYARVSFQRIEEFINVKINNISYIAYSTYMTTTPDGVVYDIDSAIEAWMEMYSQTLLEHGLTVMSLNNSLMFYVSNLEDVFNFEINVGRVDIPGSGDYLLVKKIKGSEGLLLASNEVIISATQSSSSFEEQDFSTGMVFSINNTFYPWVNQEFNIINLEPNSMNLSYQGPFWNVNYAPCDKSPFVTIAFNLGFEQSECDGIGPIIGGHFSLTEFSDTEFNMSFFPNEYETFNYEFSGNDLTKLVYIPFSNQVAALGDVLDIFDSHSGILMYSVELPSIGDIIDMVVNNINGYIYALGLETLYIVNPSNGVVITSIPLVSSSNSIVINNAGVIYIGLDNETILIINNTNIISEITTEVHGMVNNVTDNRIYGFSSAGIFEISNNIIVNTYPLGGVNNLFYEPINSSIVISSEDGVFILDDGIIRPTEIIGSNSNYEVIYNHLTNNLVVSGDDSNIYYLTPDGETILYNNIGGYGELVVDIFSGAVYITDTVLPRLIVIDSVSGDEAYQIPFDVEASSIIYNPDSKSVWFILSEENRVVQVKVLLRNEISQVSQTTGALINDTRLGSLAHNFSEPDDLYLVTRDFYRRPRENYNNDVKVDYYFKWLSDNVPEFFIYDFTGNMLKRKDMGDYNYIGEYPLETIVLNREYNRDITKIDKPEYQRTIFDSMDFTLSYIDDEQDIHNNITPLQLFLGFNSKNEGALRSILQMYKREDIEFTLQSSLESHAMLETIYNEDGSKYGVIKINDSSSFAFTQRGLKVGQHIAIFLKDNTNHQRQYISNNNGTMLKIRRVHTRYLEVDFFNDETDMLESESTMVSQNLFLDLTIKVVDKEIGRFFTYAQTEDEDIRHKIQLGNVGKLIEADDIFIFKEYDIEEGGIDWIFLNKKRKEMLMMKQLIYPYIGSYKSIINAINFFGYNDLELNEYFRNVNQLSANYNKLVKIEIPDIFDNSVDGWSESEFVNNVMANDDLVETNKFNLTYNVTDNQGNFILNYTLDEVIIKLQGLKYWLKKHIIPLTHDIMDIVGKFKIKSSISIQHQLYDVSIYNIYENLTPIYLKLNEAYLMPINSGSTVYNCVLDLYSIIPDVGADKTLNGLIDPVRPYNNSELKLPDVYTIYVKTYQTYSEWGAFVNYKLGDRVTYYGVLYESVLDNNKTNSPIRYSDVEKWVSGAYELGTIVRCDREYFVARRNFQSEVIPRLDSENWQNITQWKEIDWDIIQSLSEVRRGDDLRPFNFTVDSNLDPFITIEVISDNGYGAIYSDRKNYEIRGLKDLVNPNQELDKIGPFEPIVYL